MKLGELLIWVVSGGGAGIVSYFIWKELEGVAPGVDNWTPKAKRYMNLLLASLLGAGAYLIGVALGYETTPGDVKGWVEAVFSAVALSITLSQIVHGERDL